MIRYKSKNAQHRRADLNIQHSTKYGTPRAARNIPPLMRVQIKALISGKILTGPATGLASCGAAVDEYPGARYTSAG